MDPLENTPTTSEIPKKNFLKKTGRPFPVGVIRGVRKVGSNKILPAHREIFRNYKEQGFRHLGKAIRRTGVYSEGVANRVDAITKSRSWQTLMAEYMPEEHLALRHSELLDKREVRKVERLDEGGNLVLDSEGNAIKDEVDNGPDTIAVTKALELAYRLRGSFKKEDTPPPSTVMYNLFYKPEVREQMRVFEDGIKTALFNEINKRNMADIETEEENETNRNTTIGPSDGGTESGSTG